MACLEDKLSNDEHALDAACFTQIIRIAELSAEDYHLDRALYFKCRADRETFCAGVSRMSSFIPQRLVNILMYKVEVLIVP